MDMSVIVKNLKSRAIAYVCNQDDCKEITIETQLEKDLSESLVVTWIEGNPLHPVKQKFTLVFDTVGLYDERFNTVLSPKSLKKCSVTQLDTLELTELSEDSLSLSQEQRNAIVSALKMYMAKEQMIKGDIAYPFTLV